MSDTASTQTKPATETPKGSEIEAASSSSTSDNTPQPSDILKGLDLDPTDQEHIVNTFNSLRSRHSSLISKLTQLYSDQRDHENTIASLKEVEPDRRSWRLLGGVLVERKAGEILVNIEKQMKQINSFIDIAEKQKELLEGTLVNFQQKFKISIQR